MAKISANGATKVAEVRVTNAVEDEVFESVYVLCSDGRILRRIPGLTGFVLVTKMGKGITLNRTALVDLLRSRGYEVAA